MEHAGRALEQGAPCDYLTEEIKQGLTCLLDTSDVYKRQAYNSVIHVENQPAGDALKACIRPEDIQIQPAGAQVINGIAGEVMVNTFLGKRNQYNVRTSIGEFEVSTDQESVYNTGDKVTLSLTPNKIILL